MSEHPSTRWELNLVIGLHFGAILLDLSPFLKNEHTGTGGGGGWGVGQGEHSSVRAVYHVKGPRLNPSTTKYFPKQK